MEDILITESSAPKTRILVAGTIRNVGKTICDELMRIDKMFSQIFDCDYFLVESDSCDDSTDSLERLKALIPNFDFLSLGKLELIITNKYDRLAFCRNKYLDYFNSRMDFREYELLIVIDLDGINNSINIENIKSCLSIPFEWIALFPNQRDHYYDIFALRAKNWLQVNCWAYETYLREIGLSSIKARRVAILDHQRKIPDSNPPIKVESAFGGLGIYKAEAIRAAKYAGKDNLGCSVCEHVPFNLSISSMHDGMYIIPKFINSIKNTHNNGHTLFMKFKLYFKYALTIIYPPLKNRYFPLF